MLVDKNSLARAFAKAADGHQRRTVIEAAGIMLINALRQSHPQHADAELELDDLVVQMKAAMRENHYTENGDVKVHHIVVPLLNFDQRWP